MKLYFVYILASGRNGTLYIGVTSDLINRVAEHKEKVAEGFTEKHNVDKLVWYETHRDVNEAIKREKQLKTWNRDWKKDLIQKANPYWNDLYETLL